jgi:hypothetical protein
MKTSAICSQCRGIVDKVVVNEVPAELSGDAAQERGKMGVIVMSCPHCRGVLGTQLAPRRPAAEVSES